MRFYIRVKGKLSSITVSETLGEYLVAKTAEYESDLKNVRKAAQRWINNLAATSEVPEKNVSQWVQSKIVDLIVDPAIVQRRQQIEDRLRTKAQERAARLARERKSSP